jgi:hypothetical protein
MFTGPCDGITWCKSIAPHVFVKDYESVGMCACYLFAWQLAGPLCPDAKTHIEAKPEWDLVRSLYDMRF